MADHGLDLGEGLIDDSTPAFRDRRRQAQVREQLSAALAGRYRIERELGQGGMATVYLARDLKHNRDVAIKVLRADIAATIGAERFLREIQLAAKLTHPHILPLYDSGEADGALYFVMPNVEGHSLRERLDQTRQLPVEEAVRVTSEVAGALDYAHRHGVVHRDIKPENIMLHDGHAMVADFGIGKALGEVEGEGVTKAGMSVGTPAYMSPEQAAGETVDGRSDVYSLGCVLYEMLVGEHDLPSIRRELAESLEEITTTFSYRVTSGVFLDAYLGDAEVARLYRELYHEDHTWRVP